MCRQLKAIKKVSEAADDLLQVITERVERDKPNTPLRKAYPVEFDLPFDFAVDLRQLH